MTTLDDFFSTSTATPIHPRLRRWKQRLSQPGAMVRVEVERPAPLLGIGQTLLHLQFTKDGSVEEPETVAWDSDLNAGLVQMGVRAIDPTNETERFALSLHKYLEKAECEYGGGYLSSVLKDVVAESDLAQFPWIAEVLPHLHANAIKKEGERFELCREMVADALTGRAFELTQNLGYPKEEAKVILVQALARYLDDRFSVSHRRRLGLL